MTGRADRHRIGRWRIIEAGLWDKDFLDLVGPAMLTIRADGHGNSADAAARGRHDTA